MSLVLPLATEHLRLRPFTMSDQRSLLDLFGRPDVARYLTSEPWSVTEAEERTAKKVERADLRGPERALSLAVELDGAVIGDIALWCPGEDDRLAEIGWVIHPAFSGRGLATEAAAAVIGAAFDAYGLHRICAQLDARNTASQALASRLGMTREAHLRSNWWSKGEWTDTLIFAVLDSDPRP